MKGLGIEFDILLVTSLIDCGVEVYPKENDNGIWLCGKVTQLNGLKESCIIN